MGNTESGEPFGYTFYTPAFSGDACDLGTQLAHLDEFYDAFIFFITAVAVDPTQLVHLRASLINQLAHVPPHRATSEDPNAIIWCALSISSDRYFAAFASQCRDGLSRVTILKSKWYSFIALAFLPAKEHVKLEILELKSWGQEFVALHKHNFGQTLSQKEEIIGIIAKQAIAGLSSWQETNREIMTAQNISVEEIEAEIKRRS